MNELNKKKYLNDALKGLEIEKNGTYTEYLKYVCEMSLELNIEHPYLYQYRGDNNYQKYIFETIKHSKIWMKPMSEQNDPFEFFVNFVNFNDKSFTSEFNKYKSKLLISCFSEDYKNILMWSHYANKHQGCCLKYKTLDIINLFQLYLLPVQYTDKFINDDFIKNYPNIEERIFNLALCASTSKAYDWKYEKEWRIIRCFKDDIEMGCLQDFVKPVSIYLGLNAKEEFEFDMRGFCETHEISLYKMLVDEPFYRFQEKLIYSPKN